MTKTHDMSTGNVFADLGLPDAAQEVLKADLTVQIFTLIKNREMTQVQAAKVLGTTQAQVSALMRCRPTSISVGRLMQFLTLLGQDVEVSVRPAPMSEKRPFGRLSVSVRKNTANRTLATRGKRRVQIKKQGTRHAA